MKAWPFAAVILAGAAAASAAAAPFDMSAAWERWWPMSRTMRIVRTDRVAMPEGAQLVGLDARGAILDDGTHAWRTAGAALKELAAGTGAPSGLAWRRGAQLVALDAADGLVVFEPALAPNAGPVVRVFGALYYTSGDSLVRFEPTTKAATEVATLGRDYEGALATDGARVFVGDRESIWVWDPRTRTRRTVSRGTVYWTGELAMHGAQLLADNHGHGAQVLDAARGTQRASLGTSAIFPTGSLGWVNNSVVLAGSPIALASADAAHAWEAGDSVSNDGFAPWADGADAVFCWRAAKDGALHRLYQTAAGVEICGLAASGDSLAVIEAGRDADSCGDATHRVLVVARARGVCE